MELIWKDECIPNSLDLYLLDYQVWNADAMLEIYQCYTAKPTNITELKNVVQAIWDDRPKFMQHTVVQQKAIGV